MKITMQLEYGDGKEASVVATTRDLSAFEDKYDKTFSGGVDLRLREVGWLAWHALSRRGDAGGDFDAWWETVEDIDLNQGKKDDEATPPLGSDRPRG